MKSSTHRLRHLTSLAAWEGTIGRTLGRLSFSRRVAIRPDHPARLATGDDRIYHIHIRKTGGTSLNHIFLGVATGDTDAAYADLIARRGHCCEWNGYRYVGWNLRRITAGNYFYAFSHTPAWQLRLPPRTFTITSFRDPVERVLSHYWMLRNYVEDATDHPCMATESRWLGTCFEDFLDRVPVEHLKTQLWSFSSSCDIAEAVDRALRVSHVMFTDTFEQGLHQLEQRLALPLPHQRCRTSRKGEVSHGSLIRLRDMLADEYEFLSLITSAVAARR